jgi:excisionase family DNA binding protein
MTIIEQIQQRSSALRVGELAQLLQVTPQHIYRLAAAGLIPCFRIQGSIRLDPQEVVAWLKTTQPKMVRAARTRAA